jgi:hypothetical protein
VLHFEIKVDGDRVGTLAMTTAHPPRCWHDLYPADFRHDRAARITLEADRQALVAWWQRYRGEPALLCAPPPALPNAEHLYRLLGRQYADRWQYQPEPGTVIRCCVPPRGSTLLDLPTYDYNLVRAACIWLGTAPDPQVRERLIDLVGSPSLVLSYNACFALRYADDPRIRALVEKYWRTS